MRTSRRTILGAILPIAVVLGYAVWSSASASPYFPPLEDIALRFQELWLFAHVGSDLLPSLVNLVAGFLIAVVAGLVVGLVLGRTAWVREVCLPLINFGRSIPPLMLIPPLVLVLGIGDSAKIAIIAFGAFFPVCLATIDGMRQTDSVLLDMTRSIGLGKVATLRQVYLPSAAPSIFGGVQVALQVSLVLMVASEMLAAYRGLGYITMQAQLSFDSPTMWAGIVLLALLGFAMHILFTFVRRRVLAWHIGMRALSSAR